MVDDGAVKRVCEAIYVKVLAAPAELLYPAAQGMTAATRRLFELLYPAQRSG